MGYWANVDWDGEWDGDRPPGWSARGVFIPQRTHHTTSWEERFPDIGHPGSSDPRPRPGWQEDFRQAPAPRFRPLSPEREREVLERVAREHAERQKQASAKKQKPSHTYVIGAEGSPLVKIGFTSGTPKGRMSSLQTGIPMRLTLLWSTEGDYERDLHIRFNEYRVIGEWFDLTPLGDPATVVISAVEELRCVTVEQE
jgi:hypothetical protein